MPGPPRRGPRARHGSQSPEQRSQPDSSVWAARHVSEQPTATQPTPAVVPDWVREHYALVDAGNLDRYIEDFALDAELRFASNPPVRGRDAVREALAGGHAEHDMAHAVVGCWTVGDTTILEFDVVYTYHDGHSHTVPSVAIARRNADGLIDSLRVYVDKPH